MAGNGNKELWEFILLICQENYATELLNFSFHIFQEIRIRSVEQLAINDGYEDFHYFSIKSYVVAAHYCLAGSDPGKGGSNLQRGVCFVIFTYKFTKITMKLK